MNTVKGVAIVGRVLRFGPVVAVDRLWLGDNSCWEISVKDNNLHIEYFVIRSSELLPTFLSDYPVCSIDKVYVHNSLSVAEWHQVTSLLSHCRVRRLYVRLSGNISREDIITLWDCVQERWECGYEVIHKEEGIQKLLQSVFN